MKSRCDTYTLATKHFRCKQVFEGFVREVRNIMLNPVILAWTKKFHWDDRPIAELYNERQAVCRHKCFITDDRRYLNIAGAVLFNIRGYNAKDLPEQRSLRQLYTLLLNEPPHLTWCDLKKIRPNFFNITMTYRLDSDVQYVYDRFEKIDQSTTADQIYSWKEVERIVSKKTKSVLQLTSACESNSKRQTYFDQLQKHIKITQYGACFKKTCDKACEEEEAGAHYFILAFENGVCRDYISEKFFRTKKYLIVPIIAKDSIVRGIMPDHSYIAADQFESPKALADHMKYLESNHTEYIKYFEWTKKFKKTKRQPVVCDLSTLMHHGLDNPGMIENIHQWWVEDSHCEDAFASNLLNRM